MPSSTSKAVTAFRGGYAIGAQGEAAREARELKEKESAKSNLLKQLHSDLFAVEPDPPKMNGGLPATTPTTDPAVVQPAPMAKPKVGGLPVTDHAEDTDFTGKKVDQEKPAGTAGQAKQMNSALNKAFSALTDERYAEVYPEIFQMIDSLSGVGGQLKKQLHDEFRTSAKTDFAKYYTSGATPESKAEALAGVMSKFPDGNDYTAQVIGSKIQLISSDGQVNEYSMEEMDNHAAAVLSSSDEFYARMEASINERKERARADYEYQRGRTDSMTDYEGKKKIDQNYDQGESMTGQSGGLFNVRGDKATPVTGPDGQPFMPAADSTGSRQFEDIEVPKWMVQSGIAPDLKTAVEMRETGRADTPENIMKLSEMMNADQHEARIRIGSKEYQSPEQLYEKAKTMLSGKQGGGLNVPPERQPETGMRIQGSEERIGGMAARANPSLVDQNLPTPVSEEDYMALPPGAKYIDPDDGKVYMKPDDGQKVVNQ